MMKSRCGLIISMVFKKNPKNFSKEFKIKEALK